MSLWSKPVGEIGFADLDSFLSLKSNEGVRLDYKAKRPKDLAKIISAFANTVGGLIIIGVDEDTAKNEPVWPPVKTDHLQEADDKLRDTIEQIATEAIYPPVRTEVSRVIDNPHAPGRVLLVIRVDGSPTAPHMVMKGNELWVVEKKGASSEKFSPMHLDRIDALLERRRASTARRDEEIEAASRTAERLVSDGAMAPSVAGFRAYITPYFANGPICPKSVCPQVHPGIGLYAYDRGDGRSRHCQRTPYGSILQAKQDRDGDGKGNNTVSELRDSGLCLVYERAYSISRFRTTLSSDQVVWILLRTVMLARQFYARVHERPGLCLIGIGANNVTGHTLTFSNGYFQGGYTPAVYGKWDSVRLLHFDSFVDDPAHELSLLIEDFVHGFDCHGNVLDLEGIVRQFWNQSQRKEVVQ